MRTSKTKPKPEHSARSNPNEKLLSTIAARTTQQKQFAATVGSIEKRYGVKVASASTSAENPYAMSAEQSAKVALQAGIITPAGNLTRTFK